MERRPWRVAARLFAGLGVEAVEAPEEEGGGGEADEDGEEGGFGAEGA